MDEQVNHLLEEKNRINLVNCVFLATVVLSFITMLLPGSLFEGKPVVQLLVSQLLFVLPTIVFLVYFKVPFFQEIRLHRMKIGDILLSALFGFLIQPLLSLINAISLSFTTNATSGFIFELSEKVPWALSVILVALIPCFLEESVYRGFFYQEYRRANPKKAILLSGFLFGLMHGNLNQFCYAFAMGVIFALLIEATGSILSTMVIHFMINFGSVTSIYILPKAYEMVQSMAKLQENIGETELAEYMKEMLNMMGGGVDVSSSEWLRSMLDVSSSTNITLGTAIGMYGPSAVLFGTLAFLVFRLLAKRNGNWESICKIWAEEEQTETRLTTIPLMIAIAVGVVCVFAYEMMLKLPR